MNFNEHLFDEQIIKLLTGGRFSGLKPLPYFESYAKAHGGDLRDNERYYKPLYPDFFDYDYKHATSKVRPIYLNDFDWCLEEDREKIAKLIRMDFDSDTFDTVAQCGCGKLKANYLLGSTKRCVECGGTVERLADASLETKVWLRLPEGVASFINPGFYKTFFDSIGTISPKINIVEAILSSTYRRSIGIKRSEIGQRLLRELDSIGMELNLNSFVLNCDLFMQHFLIGEGRKITNLSTANAATMFELYHKFKDRIFPKFLPVPNRFSTIIEKKGDERTASSSQLKISGIYQSIADTKDTTDFYTASVEDIKRNIDIVGKSIINLARFNSDNLKSLVFEKTSLIRKHVISGSLPYSGRGIITSTTGIHDAGVAGIPRVMMVAMLKKHLQSYLYRQGYTPLKATSLIAKASTRPIKIIDDYIRQKEKEREIIGMLGRNPTIQFLSVRAFFLKMNDDPTDESINLPILSVGPFNADFDGKYIKIAVFKFL